MEKLVSAPVTLGPIHPDPLREAQRRRDREYYMGQAIAEGLDPEEARRRMNAPKRMPQEIERARPLKHDRPSLQFCVQARA